MCVLREHGSCLSQRHGADVQKQEAADSNTSSLMWEDKENRMDVEDGDLSKTKTKGNFEDMLM